MIPRYSVNKNNEFNDIRSVIAFLTEKEEGEFFINDFSKIKIKFNTYTGSVKLISAEKIEGITNFFDYGYLTRPVSDLISYIAKQDLLSQLDGFGNQPISVLIQTHIKKAEVFLELKESMKVIDKILLLIQKHLQDHYDIQAIDIHKIKCKKDIKSIVDVLINKLGSNESARRPETSAKKTR